MCCVWREPTLQNSLIGWWSGHLDVVTADGHTDTHTDWQTMLTSQILSPSGLSQLPRSGLRTTDTLYIHRLHRPKQGLGCSLHTLNQNQNISTSFFRQCLIGNHSQIINRYKVFTPNYLPTFPLSLDCIALLTLNGHTHAIYTEIHTFECLQHGLLIINLAPVTWNSARWT